MNSTHFALGFGIGTQDSSGNWLEVYYPAPLLHPAPALVEALHSALGPASGNRLIPMEINGWRALAEALDQRQQDEAAQLASQLAASQRPGCVMLLAEDSPPSCVPEAYLKLHLLSHRLVQPHGINLQGLFGVLPNVAWSSEGAIAVNELPQRQLAARIAGRTLVVDAVDKFPRMSDYVVPKGVRIADASRVRLGAYLGEGTTVMHEGFINFNAGTLGESMVEGRISAGVTVGKGSDLGGGCSTMGTLSGGNSVVISVGEKCLIGANAGLGIPLGDRCTIEAGLYLTAGSKVLLISADGEQRLVKARELAGQSDLLFLRNSQSGAIECRTNRRSIELNAALHLNS